MGNNEHAHVPLRQHPDHCQHFTHHRGIQGAGGLIEQQHLRLHHQAAADGNPLLLASGKHRRPGVGTGSKAHLGKQSHGFLLRFRTGHFQDSRRRETQVVHHVHLGKQVELLKYHAHAAANLVNLCAFGSNLPPVDHDLPRIRFFQQAQGTQKHALAAAGTADNRDSFSLFHGQVYAFEHFQRTEGFLQPFHFNQTHAAAPRFLILILSESANSPNTM